MRDTMRHTSTLAAALVAGFILASTAAAQKSSRVLSAPGHDAASTLEAAASQPKANQADWVQAAQALVQAAGLRATTDPRCAGDLLAAGVAFYNGGKPAVARRTFMDAARHYVNAGDADQAAQAYLAAAIVASELNQGDMARAAVGHAERLATSPTLTPEQKAMILFRIGKFQPVRVP